MTKIAVNRQHGGFGYFLVLVIVITVQNILLASTHAEILEACTAQATESE